jgi:hypothetical protein
VAGLLFLDLGAVGIGGAYQQTSEREAQPVSVEERGKTTGKKRKIAIISAYEHTN